MSPIFTRCVKIVESGLVSAGLPCFWFDVEIRCRFTRHLNDWVFGKPTLLQGYVSKLKLTKGVISQMPLQPTPYPLDPQWRRRHWSKRSEFLNNFHEVFLKKLSEKVKQSWRSGVAWRCQPWRADRLLEIWAWIRRLPKALLNAHLLLLRLTNRWAWQFRPTCRKRCASH